MKSLFAIAFLLTSISANFASAQVTSHQTRQYNAYNDEKIHLHLDKPYYAAGDIIWLKAYVVDYLSNRPSSTSGILYVDLINERNQITRKLKLQLKGGTAWGHIELADSVSEGNYRITAYTQWMRNFGKDYFFNHHFKVGNSLSNNVYTKTAFSAQNDKNNTQIKSNIQLTKRDGKPYSNAKINYQVVVDGKVKNTGNAITDASGFLKLSFTQPLQVNTNLPQYISLSVPQSAGVHIAKTIPIKMKLAKPDVQFLPEGGQLIDGLPCKIGIKSIGQNGLGFNIDGTIVDQNGIEVTTFETTYLGMGNCVLTPEINKTYTAKVTLSDGQLLSYPLPVIAASGYQLAVNTLDSGKIDIKVLTSKALINSAPLRLLARRGANVLFDMAISTEQQIAALSIPSNVFPLGVVQFTLFNVNEQPVAERMVFINNLALSEINLQVDKLKSAYTKRELVTFNIIAAIDSISAVGSFSVAAINTNIGDEDIANETNLLSSLLLKADIAGHIEKPNTYFINSNAEMRSRLDNLMLTQAWRTYHWKLKDTNYFVKYPPEKSLKIEGTVSTLGKKPLAAANAILMFPNNKMLVANTETAENGSFSFQDIYLEDEQKFIVQANTKDGNKHVNVNINKVDEQVVQNSSTLALETDVNLSINNYLQSSQDYFDDLYKKGFLNKTNVLKTVTITEKISPNEEKAAPYTHNRNGRGRADQVISAKELENVHSLELFIARGSIRSLTIERPTDGGPPFAALTRTPYGRVSYELDGMVINNLELHEISIDDIESIEVLINPAFLTMYGTTVNGALLVISTKRGKGRQLSDIHAPGLVASSIKGYSPIKMFYAPQYNVEQTIQPDLRTTVYWNPNLTTDKNGKLNVSFYNGDKTGKHRILIEGIDANGNLARKILNYEVK